ncbi:hypothetical protein M8J75_001820 [Diaphorina citri]|nr:hypothetical protein M8J75_001820 [Diaphorina citri]
MEINLVNINKMLTELCKSKFTLKHLGDSVSIRTTNITDYELIKKKLKEINKMYHTFTPTDRRDPFHPPKRRRTVVVVKNLTQWAGAGSGTWRRRKKFKLVVFSPAFSQTRSWMFLTIRLQISWLVTMERLEFSATG